MAVARHVEANITNTTDIRCCGLTSSLVPSLSIVTFPRDRKRTVHYDIETCVEVGSNERCKIFREKYQKSVDRMKGAIREIYLLYKADVEHVEFLSVVR